MGAEHVWCDVENIRIDVMYAMTKLYDNFHFVIIHRFIRYVGIYTVQAAPDV